MGSFIAVGNEYQVQAHVGKSTRMVIHYSGIGKDRREGVPICTKSSMPRWAVTDSSADVTCIPCRRYIEENVIPVGTKVTFDTTPGAFAMNLEYPNGEKKRVTE